MPELPEVETVVRQLRGSVSGIHLKAAKIFDHRLSHLDKVDFGGLSVRNLERYGKYIVFGFHQATKSSGKSSVPGYLAIHLRMTGRLFWLDEKMGGKGDIPPEAIHSKIPFVHQVSLKPAHLRFVLFAKEGSLIFADPRRFGTVELLDEPMNLLGGGIDPTRGEFSEDVLRNLLSKHKQPIKSWLLRQDRVVGVGNIYASEILFRAGIHPSRAADSLRKKEILALHLAIREILLEAIERNGTTFSDFQSPSGEYGGFQEFLTVYEREGEPCRKCSSLIVRVAQAGRSTYFCKKCQKP